MGQHDVLGRQMTLLPPSGELTAVAVRAHLNEAGRVALECEAELPGVAPLPVEEREALSAVLLRLGRLREHRAEEGADAGSADADVAVRAVGAAAGPNPWRQALRVAVSGGGGGGEDGRSGRRQAAAGVPASPAAARGLLFRSVLDALRLAGEGSQRTLALEVSQAAVRALQLASAPAARRVRHGGGAVLLRREGVTLRPGARSEGDSPAHAAAGRRCASVGGALVVVSHELRRDQVGDAPSSSWYLHVEAYDPQRKHSIACEAGAEALRRFNAALPLVPPREMGSTPRPLATGYGASPAWATLAQAVEERAAWCPPPQENGLSRVRRPRGTHAGTMPRGASLAVDLTSPRRVTLWRGGATLCESDPPARVSVSLEFPVAEGGGELPPPRCTADAYLPATMRRTAAATPLQALLPDRFPQGGEAERRLRDACAEAERGRLEGAAEGAAEGGAALLREVADSAVSRLKLPRQGEGEGELAWSPTRGRW